MHRLTRSEFVKARDRALFSGEGAVDCDCGRSKSRKCDWNCKYPHEIDYAPEPTDTTSSPVN
jgi:hypothetical protein